MMRMSIRFDVEDQHGQAFVEEIQGLFSMYTFGSENRGHVTSDKLISVKLHGKKYNLANLELMNEFGGITSDQEHMKRRNIHLGLSKNKVNCTDISCWP